MLIVILAMLSGILVGYLFRKVPVMRAVPQTQTVLIWALLFILGIEVGSNDRIVNGFASLGLESIVLAVGATLGSLLAAWALWIIVNHRKSHRS